MKLIKNVNLHKRKNTKDIIKEEDSCLLFNNDLLKNIFIDNNREL
jgi:hypothetical protein